MAEEYWSDPILDAIDQECLVFRDNGSTVGDRTRHFVYGMVRAYIDIYREEPFSVVSVEEEFRIPFSRLVEDISPALACQEIGFNSEWSWAGKIDAVVDYEGSVFILEHKTTASPIDNDDGVFWSSMEMSGQVASYMLALFDQGVQVAGTIYDAVRKPAIRPRKITKSEIEGLENHWTYQGQELALDSARASEYLAELEQQEWRESDYLYGVRVQETMMSAPEKYFGRRVVKKTRKQLAEFVDEAVQTVRLIESSRDSQRHMRHLGSCYAYSKPCQYISLCQRLDNPDSDRWQKRAKRNSELSKVDQSRELLTHSRKECYQLCPRKHHYQYDLQLERKGKPQDGNLTIGSLFHRGLEAHFQRFISSDSGNATEGQDHSG